MGAGTTVQCTCLEAAQAPSLLKCACLGSQPAVHLLTLTRPAPAHPLGLPCPPRLLPCSNVAEFNRGDLFVIRYRAVQQLLAEGAVELV